MKKWFCAALVALLAFGAAACSSEGQNGTSGTEPTVLRRPDLSSYASWVLTTEYELSSEKHRSYEYDNQGNLTGFSNYKAVREDNDRGGKTVKLTAYDDHGQVSALHSKFEYIYDEAGLLVEYRREEPISSKLADSFVFTYDSEGRLVKQEKFYMELPQETVSYTYDADRLTGASYQTSVYDVTYTYTYGQEKWPDSIEFTKEYVKTGNREEGKLVIGNTVDHDASHFRLTLMAAEGSVGVAVGQTLLVYEELIDSLGDADAVRLQLGDWGNFQMGWVPMGQLGALNAVNWSGGSATLVFKPLSVYLTEKN